MKVLQTFVCIVILFQSGAFAQDNAGISSPADDSVDGEVGVTPATGPGVAPENPEIILPRDMVLVLDNSGSMKRTDPEFQVKTAISDFIARLGDATRLAIIIFDQQTTLAVALTAAAADNHQQIVSSLGELNYNGLFRDTPTAIERAVYELRNNGRDDADKHVVLITDGGFETDNSATQPERSEWLSTELSEITSANGIAISGIGLTANADMELIRDLAGKTGGQAYPVMSTSELGDVMVQLELDTRRETVMPVPSQAVETTPEVIASPQAPVAETIDRIPVQGLGREERMRSIIIMVAAGILVITLGTLIILLLKRSRDYRKGLDASASEAWLNDINRYTARPAYKLGRKATMLGRVAGKDTGHLDYVVIPESTIGRRHAVIEYKDYGYWIVDQGSINGTFVNDVRVNGDTRLKHGDRIRLHKFEFEFIMPDLDEAGATRLSATAGTNDSGTDADIEAVKADLAADSALLDFDFSGEAADVKQGTSSREADGDDDTLMPGYETAAGPEGQGTEDETLMPGFDKISGEPDSDEATPGADQKQSGSGQDEETLMPGHFDESDDDATIRPDQGGPSGKTNTSGDKDN